MVSLSAVKSFRIIIWCTQIVSISSLTLLVCIILCQKLSSYNSVDTTSQPEIIQNVGTGEFASSEEQESYTVGSSSDETYAGNGNDTEMNDILTTNNNGFMFLSVFLIAVISFCLVIEAACAVGWEDDGDRNGERETEEQRRNRILRSNPNAEDFGIV